MYMYAIFFLKTFILDVLNVLGNRGYIHADEYNTTIHREEQNHQNPGTQHISKPTVSQYSGV